MNEQELKHLSKAISNDAKLLYCIGIRPLANIETGQTTAVNYRALLTCLNGSEQRFTLGRQINQLIDELIVAGLITLTENTERKQQSYNNRQFSLPLLIEPKYDIAHLHTTKTPMTEQWLPNDQAIATIAAMIGLINSDYTSDDVGEFKAYWLGRTDSVFSLYQWTQKFVFQIKNQRTISHNNQHIIGTQTVPKAPGISISNNAKKLIEKYHGKNSKTDQ